LCESGRGKKGVITDREEEELFSKKEFKRPETASQAVGNWGDKKKRREGGGGGKQRPQTFGHVGGAIKVLKGRKMCKEGVQAVPDPEKKMGEIEEGRERLKGATKRLLKQCEGGKEADQTLTNSRWLKQPG